MALDAERIILVTSLKMLQSDVLRYCDHGTSRCQDDISTNANNGSHIVARNGESTHIYYER